MPNVCMCVCVRAQMWLEHVYVSSHLTHVHRAVNHSRFAHRNRNAEKQCVLIEMEFATGFLLLLLLLICIASFRPNRSRTSSSSPWSQQLNRLNDARISTIYLMIRFPDFEDVLSVWVMAGHCEKGSVPPPYINTISKWVCVCDNIASFGRATQVYGANDGNEPTKDENMDKYMRHGPGKVWMRVNWETN